MDDGDDDDDGGVHGTWEEEGGKLWKVGMQLEEGFEFFRRVPTCRRRILQNGL